MVVFAVTKDFVTSAKIFGSGFGSGVAAAATAGAASSVASQGFLMATGAQSKFDWGGLAISAISAGVSKGLPSELVSTGLRRSEIVNLSLTDIDRERGVVLVREGKGGKDRIVPIGARALTWIDLHLAKVHPLYPVGNNGDALFLSRERRPLRGCSLWKVAHRSIAEAGKTGACHAFRHTAATQMLEGGADIRFIQAMLGHASLATTEIYTQVSIQSLKRVHAATHPAEAAHGDGELARVAFLQTESTSDVSLAPRALAQLRASVAGVHVRAARRARQAR